MSEQRIAEMVAGLLASADEAIAGHCDHLDVGFCTICGAEAAYVMTAAAKALSASPAETGHLVGRNGVIEERECVACHQFYPTYSAESVMRCYQCRAAETGRASETSGIVFALFSDVECGECCGSEFVGLYANWDLVTAAAKDEAKWRRWQTTKNWIQDRDKLDRWYGNRLAIHRLPLPAPPPSASSATTTEQT